jgi:GNAT superfamily N-acetyltransferase
MASDLRIEPLTDTIWPDLAALFDQGGDPKWCSCAYFRMRAKDFSASTRAQHRERLRGLVGDDPAPGLVAYRGGRAIGWVSLGPRAGFERIVRSRILVPIDDRPVWSIVCFVVSRPARGTGVARALLDAAVGYAREHGAPAVEGYPVDTGGARTQADWLYTGTVTMFEDAGFRIAGWSVPVGPAKPRPIVRLELKVGHARGKT